MAGVMRAARLRHLITLWQPQLVQTALGEKQLQWLNVATVWAGVEPVNGTATYSADQTHYQPQTRFILRYRADVQAGWQLEYQGQRFLIQQVLDQNGLGRELQLLAEGQQGGIYAA
jgi:SPP1 family predicted phage head-tail adaptor